MGHHQPAKEARLVQPLIRNHPDLARLSRASLNTLRVTSMQFPDGRVVVFAAGLRMALGDAVEDTTGGFISLVDLETGVLGPATTLRMLGGSVSHHPDTGVEIAGTRVPFWNEVMALVRRAHSAFPNFPLVGWDVAVTPEGPLVVEANTRPRLDVMQVRPNRPLALSEFCDLYWSWREGR